MALTIARAEQTNGARQNRLEAILHTAIADAVVATWAAKYTYNRKTPSQVASDLTVVPTVGGPPPSTEPSYPSEDAAITGTAVGILTTLYPKEANDVQAMAAEIQQTRLVMGANYRSDLEAGFALGQAVAQKALARAASGSYFHHSPSGGGSSATLFTLPPPPPCPWVPGAARSTPGPRSACSSRGAAEVREARQWPSPGRAMRSGSSSPPEDCHFEEYWWAADCRNEWAGARKPGLLLAWRMRELRLASLALFTPSRRFL
jgi:hypothetical protein